MARAKEEFEGELIAHLLRFVGIAVWSPKDLPGELNPFKEESEAMKAHRAKWNLRKLGTS